MKSEPIFSITSYPMLTSHVANNSMILFHKFEDNLGFNADGTNLKRSYLVMYFSKDGIIWDKYKIEKIQSGVS